MVETGKSLPKAQGHGGHGSLIAKTGYGSTETRFDGQGNVLDRSIETIKGAKGRMKTA